jgi:transposase-like protein
MGNGRTQHPNARLTAKHRRRMVGCVLERGWSIEITAERFQVDSKTVRKWRDRFVAEGDAGTHADDLRTELTSDYALLREPGGEDQWHVTCACLAWSPP